MDNRRLFLLAAGLFVAFLLYQAWMRDYGPPPAPATPAPAAQTRQPAVQAETPPLPPDTAMQPAAKPAVTAAAPGPTPAAHGALLQVRTDVLALSIDTTGGNLRDVQLLAYPTELQQPQQHVRVLNSAADKLLMLQSGLQTRAGPAGPGADARYEAAATDYRLAPGQDSLSVKLVWRGPQGLEVDKVYRFTRDSYQVALEYTLHNHGREAWQGATFAQFRNHYTPASHSLFSVHRYDYQRVALHGSDGYKQYEYSELTETPLSAKAADGWIAVVSHYFLAAAIPGSSGQTNGAGNYYYSKSLGDADYLAGVVSAPQQVAAGASASFSDTLFLGPKLQTRLAAVAPGLELTVDYGKLTIIAEPIFWVLEQIHRFIGNWGWSILVLTLLLKLLTYKLNEISGRSMARMKLVQPRLKALQERYKDDRAKQSQAMMEFYKKEKINPMGGCLPMLVQMPIFFALYYVLVYSVELRQSPWIGWIHDLSAPDPYYILPVVYGIVMFIQQRISPQPTTDPMQRKIMMFMPVGIAVFYVILPSGLALYYVANSILTIAQQWRINHVIERDSRKHAEKK
ncbi:MAG TPA: membrane protein insertase YidC [Gammaproteobacteria bacterium]|nr:membrane protein insertase YidC [Gammaproteobacteria bacterium]